MYAVVDVLIVVSWKRRYFVLFWKGELRFSLSLFFFLRSVLLSLNCLGTTKTTDAQNAKALLIYLKHCIIRSSLLLSLSLFLSVSASSFLIQLLDISVRWALRKKRHEMYALLGLAFDVQSLTLLPVVHRYQHSLSQLYHILFNSGRNVGMDQRCAENNAKQVNYCTIRKN